MSGTAGSDLLLERMTRLHPKIIDLTLGRVERLLEALGHPERQVPPSCMWRGPTARAPPSP
jgi:dihydrofolate synthase/folylpolyglutamate synthase